MCTEKLKLRNVKVEYVKGKYTYKQRINTLNGSGDFIIKLSGTLSSIKNSPSKITNLYEEVRNQGRLDGFSRYAIKGLQMNLSNSRAIESKGVTHIIVYECLNK